MKICQFTPIFAAILFAIGANSGWTGEQAKKAQESRPRSPVSVEREQKPKDLIEKRGASPPLARSEVKKMTAEERAAKRGEMEARLQKQLAELRKKQAQGSLTPEQKQRLERVDELAKRFGKTASAGAK